MFSLNSSFGSTIPNGIIGGQRNAPYAALLESDGSVVTLPGLPPTGLTFRVAMNRSGEGLIGGTNGTDAYAAFVAPNGSLTSINGLMAPGEIYTVAINGAGNGIIGGGRQSTNVPYAALVNTSGTSNSIVGLPANGLIYGVAIDSSGEGIIGGVGPTNSAYAALVSPDGTLTTLSGLPSTGTIFWVATNDSQKRFIGGQNGASVYAAFINPDQSLTEISNLPQGLNYSVAINESGLGIMGGTSLNLPYAALVSANGTATTVPLHLTAPGIIYNVTINETGTGLISGFSASKAYGAFVSPDGTLTPLLGLPEGVGFLDGTALHSTGIGLVGGTSNNTPFAAVVAPNGALTYLTGLPSNGQINSTAIAILDNLVPDHIGQFDSWANTQFTLSNALSQHSMLHYKEEYHNCCCEAPSSVWMSIFGNYVHEKVQNSIPSFSNEIAGVLIGYDYNKIQDVVLGAGLSYAFNHVRFSKNNGHADINHESAVVYASLNKSDFYINAALWGGIFQTSHRRNSLLGIVSKSSPSGWNLSPHLEVSIPLTLCSCPTLSIDPFVMFDWTNNWQYNFRERGSSGFNIKLNDQYVSIFRGEVGVRFFETLCYDWGRIILEEKISYVNRTPTCKKNGRASFIGANSSFNVITLNTSSINQGAVQLHIECIPASQTNIYASLDYQGEYGSSLQSNCLTLSIGKNF